MTRTESNIPDLHAPELFWAQMAPGDHLLQLYDTEQSRLDSLEAFVAGGLMLGEGVVVLGTSARLAQLELRLLARGLDVSGLQIEDRLIVLDADRALDRFMRDGIPDKELFDEAIERLILRATGAGRPVRAYGEMVGVLWARGAPEAALALEEFWQAICDRHGIALLCGYAKSVFGSDQDESIRRLCAAHSSVVMG